jgi:EAL domain-containing protein (putative c-di-GMP-specific phosphodiesterase class I)
LGCDVAQGYAIARPMPVHDFLEWLDAAQVSTPRRA